MDQRNIRPIIALTMGDVAGIGPEVIARGWLDPRLHALARPLVVGDPTVMARALELVNGGESIRVQIIASPGEADPSPNNIPCLWLERRFDDLSAVKPGLVDARAGRAHLNSWLRPSSSRLAGRIDAITTLPLNKHALHLGGIDHPGHTEILAERCGVKDHAMMLYMETSPASPDDLGTASARQGSGLGVVHVTLHVALRNVFGLLTEESILSKIRLAHEAMRPLTDRESPPIAVTALNPHAGEDGLFGDEEETIIGPAVVAARDAGPRRIRTVSQRHPVLSCPEWRL